MPSPEIVRRGAGRVLLLDFTLRVAAFAVSLAGLDQLEQDTVDGYRWWGAAETESSGEEFHPADLPRLMREPA